MAKGNFFWVLILIFTIFSCQKEFDPYARPEWLDGKVYTQVKSDENLSTFAKCIELTEYDKLLDVSGSYTVFAPTNEAFELYFSNNPSYNQVEDIPLAELSDLVKYHIVQNPWTREQLRSLDVEGWIDPDDEYNDEPRGYKRETLLLRDDRNYGVKILEDDIEELIIVDTLESTWHRKIATDSRKYAPLFYQEYFQLYNLQLADYSFFFDRSFESPDDIFYVNAKIAENEIPAENGFVYSIDRVVEPLPSASEILSDKNGKQDYSKFLDLVNQFPNFTYNEEKTFDQPGADLGLEVDSLFDLTYPQLAFNIINEKTKAPQGAGFPSEVSIRFHHGLLAPTNEAFDQFIQQYVEGSNQWGSLLDMPPKIKRIIANTYFSQDPIYDTEIAKGINNGEEDLIHINQGDIVEKQYASNCTFIGINKAIVPRAFKSVTGPIYRQRWYKTMMNAIEYSGLTSALKREDQQIALFALKDADLQRDSSLFYNYTKRFGVEYESFTSITLEPSVKTFYLSKTDIRILLLNQITTETPKGIASKEFLKTLGGNYIIWNNENESAKGTSESLFGFRGTRVVDVKPKLISTDADNGFTYETDAWFRFTSNEIYTVLTGEFPYFHNLLVKAGLSLDKEYTYSFLSQNKLYTILIPTAEALAEAEAENLEGQELEDFLRLHFIQDDIIFTDGKLTPGYYKTACMIPISGTNRMKNAEIYIEPGIDQISIGAKDSGNYLTFYESESTTNKITSRSIASDTETNFPSIISTGVIHQIDKALLLDAVDVK